MNYRIKTKLQRNVRPLVSLFISYLLFAAPLFPVAATTRLKVRDAYSGATRDLRVKNKTAATPIQSAPASAPAGVTGAPFAAPVITATKTAAFPDPDGDGKAQPGDTITYTVTISNTGGADATGVAFNDTPDANTTLVGGSTTATPVAVNDTYSAIGNVQISIPAPGLLTNDVNPLTGDNTGLTASGPATSTNNGNVTVNSDGSFTYNPAPGFTGTDTFTYTATNPSSQTNTATVTITVSNLIWFINNAASPGGDGRITAPFNTIAAYNSSAPTKDPNDIVFLYSSASPYTGNLTLVNGMQLIGQGVDLATVTGISPPTGSTALPTASSNPDVDSTAGNTVTLGTNNTIRGLNLRNSAGIDLIGSSFGTLTTSALGLTGTGRPLNLNTGVLAATFSVINSTSSTGGQGISLSSVSGTMTVTGGTTIASATTQGILVTGSTANVDFGNTSISGATDGISLQNNSSGTRSFGTISVTGATGVGFLHAVGGGAVSITGATTITNPTGTGIQITNSNANVAFAGTTVSKNNAGFALDIETNTSRTISFSTLSVTASATGIFAQAGGTLNVTTASGSQITAPQIMDVNGMTLGLNFATLSSTTGPASMPAIRVIGSSGTLSVSTSTTITNPGNQGIALSTDSTVFGFGNTTVSGSGGTGVALATNTGAVGFAALNISPSANQPGLTVTGSSGGVSSTSGTITTSNAAAVDATSTGLNMTLTAINVTVGAALGVNGINLNTVTGTLSVGGGTITEGGGIAVNVVNGSPNVTYQGNVTINNGGQVANVSGTTAGTVAFNTGTVTGGSANTGVTITNANGNVSFANLNLGTSGARMSSQAVTISGGTGTYSLGAVSIFTSSTTGIGSTTADGTINSTSGTVDSSTGTAISITGPAGLTTLGMTLTSVSSGASTANGIILTNTSGSFAVNGTGSAGSGGTITGKTGADASFATQGTGVYINAATNVTLKWLNMSNFSNFAIKGVNVSGFTMDHLAITGVNGSSATGGSEECSIRFDGLTGTASMTNSSVSGGFFDNIRVLNTAAGTLNRLTVDNVTVGANSTANGNDGLHVESAGTATTTLNVTVQNSFFTSARANLLDAVAQGSSHMDAVVRSNKFSNNHSNIVSGGGGVTVQGSGSGQSPTMTYDISCNTFRDSHGSALVVFKGNGGGSLTGDVINNAIGVTGVSLSGSTQASGMTISGNGTGTHTILIRGNTIRQTNEAGIRLLANDGSSTMNASVFGNTYAEPGSFQFAGLDAEPGALGSDTNTMNIVIGSAGTAADQNDFSTGDPSNFSDVNFQVGGATHLNLSKNGSASATTSQVVKDDNLNPATTAVASAGTVTLVTTVPTLPPAVGTCTTVASLKTPDKDNNSTLASNATSQVAPANAVAVLTNSELAGSVASRALFGNQIAHMFASNAAFKPAKSVAANQNIASSNQPVSAASTQLAPQAQPARAVAQPLAVAPASKPVAAAVHPLAPAPPPGGISLTIGTLPVGKSVTITFQVTVNNPFPAGVTQVANQGTVSGSNFASVLTDDPSVPGSANPTVTLISSTQIAVNDASTVKPATGTKNMLFTVSLTAPAASPLTVNFATAPDTGGTHPATAGTDYDSTSGILSFATGEQVKTIPVVIHTNASTFDLTFLMNLSGASTGTIVRPQAVGTIKAQRTPSIAIIDEFRTSGPGGPGDDFIEVFNTTASPLTVGGTGWAVVKSGSSCDSAPIIVGVIPNGTVIPVGGHYLLTGSQYSLGSPNGYPSGTGKADGDLVMTSDLDNDTNIGVFKASTIPNISSNNLLDAVGSGTGSICDLLKEGTPVLPATGSTAQYSYVRNLLTGLPQDTDDNLTDFVVVSTNPFAAVGSNLTPTLGAPGPENLNSPSEMNGLIPGLIDPAVAATVAPNRVRNTAPYTDTISNTSPGPGPGPYPLGTLIIRRQYTNNTGHTVTRLRFRLIDVTTFPTPNGGTADMQGVSSPASQSVTTSGGPVTVIGTAIEGVSVPAPSQPFGAGINSTMTVPLGLPLANGSTINVQWMLGVKQGGTFRFFVDIEGQ